MGYESHWTGQVHITPPLTWAEIKNGPGLGLQDLKLRLDEQTEDTPTGQIRTITAPLIEPLTDNACNGYAIDAELQSIINTYPAHKFTGAIEARPLDPGGTPWRYAVQGRTVVRQEPRMVWPGDDEGAVLALTQTERHMLRCALDQAQERIWAAIEPADQEQAAIDKLRRLADEAEPAPEDD